MPCGWNRENPRKASPSYFLLAPVSLHLTQGPDSLPLTFSPCSCIVFLLSFFQAASPGNDSIRFCNTYLGRGRLFVFTVALQSWSCGHFFMRCLLLMTKGDLFLEACHVAGSQSFLTLEQLSGWVSSSIYTWGHGGSERLGGSHNVTQLGWMDSKPRMPGF